MRCQRYKFFLSTVGLTRRCWTKRRKGRCVSVLWPSRLSKVNSESRIPKVCHLWNVESRAMASGISISLKSAIWPLLNQEATQWGVIREAGPRIRNPRLSWITFHRATLQPCWLAYRAAFKRLSKRPITTGADRAINQSEFLEITSNLLKAREKSRVQGAIGFGFASHWLKNRRKIFEPITNVAIAIA